MVAISSEQGYEATKIGDLVKMAGVSRAAFYEHFADKKECLLAAVEALVEPTIALIERAEDAPTGEARVRQAVEAFLGLIASQPAASRMGFIEVYAAGPEGEATVERALDTFERFGVSQLNQIPGRKGMPPQMVRAMIGGLQKVIHKRLYSDEADQLPRLAEDDRRLGPLLPAAARARSRRRGGAGARRGRSPSARRSPTRRSGSCGRWRRSSPRRATRRPRSPRSSNAPAPRSASSTGTSRAKKRRFLAALDSGSAQMLATVLPAFRRARSWQESVRGGLRGDVRVRDRRARVHPARRGRDVHGRQAGAADPRHG